MVKTYSKRIQGNENVAPNFKVKEFACKDGSDAVLIDSTTVNFIQSARNLLGIPITINSGYRTVEYNAKVGGAKSSYHCKGMACDTTSKLGALVLARAYQLMGANGIGFYSYSPFCHVDSRTSKSYWQQDKKNVSYYKVNTFCTTHMIMDVQKLLNSFGFDCGLVDGVIGRKTRTAFIDFCNKADKKYKDCMVNLLKA